MVRPLHDSKKMHFLILSNRQILSRSLSYLNTVDPRSVKDPKELPYMQRPGGSADDSDLGKKGGFFNFGGFGKKKEPEPEPEPPKKNFWTF